MGTRRRLLVAGVGVTGALAAGGAAFGLGGRGRKPVPRQAARSTATVRRMTLADSRTFPAEVTYEEQAPLSVRVSGTVTALPAPGTVLNPGDVLCRVDDRPVVLFAGAVPAYRPLRSGDKGPDVRQLEEGLRALGFAGFTPDDRFNGATADAVSLWQKRLGVTRTGTVDLGLVTFREKSLRVGEHKARVGDAAGVLYDATGTERQVVLTVERKYQALVAVGKAAGVVVAGRTVAGTVARVKTGEKVTAVVTVAEQEALATDAPVDVRLVTRERKDVLAVPIVALLALDRDRYGVEVVDGGAARVVPVDVGLFAQGQVEVSGDGIAEGVTVSVPAERAA
ncbi:peptidoglycan-binding protein [Virgisporangium aliadipatigenens]|uniref:Peptidoglycan-binding protein n=1 Tax=Virgisporangium aliadipatigenens TaxID=741659 RepID=A0A8J3YKQ2_9ACTN|nr:peptidoglycan-binding protein [Virgisporangium aliadipatigenens]GIJ45578.1 peptidoglycan-binding protein [Virgisporangium aliadipatigenens]